MRVRKQRMRRTILRVQPLIWATALLFAAAPASSDSFTVSGYTFQKPSNGAGFGQRENRAVQQFQSTAPVSATVVHSPEEQAAAQAAVQAAAQQKALQDQEKQRIQTNLQSLEVQLSASSTTAVPRTVLHINTPKEDEIATRQHNLEVAIEDTSHSVGVLREEAREEYYWFAANQYDLYWGAFWGGMDPTGQQSPLDETAMEARDHFNKYLAIVRKLESITHTAEYARQRYEERVRYLSFARSGDFNAAVSDETAKTDIYPPADDFHPWSEDEIIKQGVRCKFNAAGKCL